MSQTTLDFSACTADRTRDFVGCGWVFAEIDQWLADPDAPHYFIITSEPGIGKTAIAARRQGGGHQNNGEDSHRKTTLSIVVSSMVYGKVVGASA